MAKAKLPSTIDEQIAKLKQRGCVIEDTEYARETLKHINYFRLVNYFEPFQINKKRYQEGTSFNKIMRIYDFDRKLRSILIAALEEVEISLRAVISNYHALKYGALGYLNASSFDFHHNHNSFMSKIRHLVEQNEDREFVRHYNNKYQGAFPLWVVTELFSFGTLAFFYKDMHNADKKQIADKYFDCGSSDLDNWIFCLNELRNFCAHYNRLYGNSFTVLPKTPHNSDYELDANVFGYIMVMKQLYHDKEKWNQSIVKPLIRQIAKNHDVIRLSDLGFPDDWDTQISFK